MDSGWDVAEAWGLIMASCIKDDGNADDVKLFTRQ